MKTEKWQKFITGLLLVFLIVPLSAVATPDAEVQQQLEQQLSTTKGEKKTLANKIKQLRNEQTRLQLQIKATNIKLNTLDKKITVTVKNIETNTVRIARLKTDLSKLIRLLHQKDQELLLLRLFTEKGISQAFTEVNNYHKLSNSLGSLVQETRKAQQELNTQQTAYEEQQDDARELLSIAKIQQNSLTGKLDEQARLLEATQGLETTYQNLLKDSKKQAAEIRSRIYDLLGVSTQITFGQAVAIAQAVDKQTGVPAAFLLAILTQESNLGKNVGTCNRPGDPPEKGWRVIMKPTRDQEPFIAITAELGRDPDITPVSCPMRNKDGSQLGWGGAMGPAQFIPSTWMGYKDKVSAMTGKSPANPWDIRDAFMAAALLLKNNGANDTKDGQWKAAMRYFSGGTNTKYRFYGDNVLTLTAKYEQDIKDLGN